MPKEKVANLSGGLLDAAVAKANGWPFDINPIGDGRFCYLTQGAESFCPSTSWATGGPIIEREFIAIAPYEHGIGEPSMWVAWVEERRHQATFDSYFERGIFDDNSRGHTPLIAAMRAYVCSKLGEEVELP